MSTFNTTSTNTTTTITTTPPLSSPTIDSKPSEILTAIVALLALISIPTLIFAFFFAIKCPLNPFHRPNHSSGETARELTKKTSNLNKLDVVSEVKRVKEMKVKDEYCVVCLSMFVEGEEVRELKVCKHCFHVVCIDTWLYSHFSCPVCRASVAGKCSKLPVFDGEDDLRQGLPDSESLV